MPKIPVTPTFLRMIKQLKATDQYTRRHDYAYRHSAGRTESTKELQDKEMLAVIIELETTFKIKDQCEKMRKKMISFAHQMYWQLPEGGADMWRINDWCINKGPYKKELNKHSFDELKKLLSVFEKVYKHYMSKI